METLLKGETLKTDGNVTTVLPSKRVPGYDVEIRNGVAGIIEDGRCIINLSPKGNFNCFFYRKKVAFTHLYAAKNEPKHIHKKQYVVCYLWEDNVKKGLVFYVKGQPAAALIYSG